MSVAHRVIASVTRPLPISRTAIALSTILLIALAARVFVLEVTLGAPCFAWSDSDRYLSGQAASLVRSGHWRWTWDAVDYVWHGQHWTLAPLYPVFLSLIGAVADPMKGAVAHIALSVAAVGLLFRAGQSLHSARAGLVAAGLAAVWLSEVGAAPHFMQERLFVPLMVAAFALLLRATSTDDRRPAWFAVAGVVFALAGLTRPTALYYLPVAAGIVAFGPGRPSRRVAAWQALALLAGSFIVAGPYVAAVSAARGQLILVDNHGAIESFQNGAFSPLTEIASRMTTAPVEYLSEKLLTARALLHLNGGRWTQHYGTASTPEGALAWKLLAHAFIDVPLLLVATLAPVGLVLARARRGAWLLGAWIAMSVILTTLAGYGGARYRVPIEFPMMLLASVPLAHGLPRGVLAMPRLMTAAAVSAAIMVLLLMQVPATLKAVAEPVVKCSGAP